MFQFKKRFIISLSILLLFSVGFSQAFATTEYSTKESAGYYFTTSDGSRNSMFMMTTHTIVYTSVGSTKWPLYVNGFNQGVQFYRLADMSDYTYNISDYLSKLYLTKIELDIYGVYRFTSYPETFDNTNINGINRGMNFYPAYLQQLPSNTNTATISFRLVGAGSNVFWNEAPVSVSNEVLRS